MSDFESVDAGDASPGKANIGKRIGGYLIDAITMALISFALSFGGVILSFVIVSALSLYLFGWRMGETGVTPGKQIVGLKIVDANTGELLGSNRGLQRAGLIWIIGSASIFPVAGYLFMVIALIDVVVALVDDRGQRVTDRIVGSIVTDA
ncbi:MAG TPA: RDD family protein [Acidimicrobiales bacterium]|nr:RDD family protein [Acidimicrobiales bacterium]|tara:strand:- start:4232 stop:4681 length:450 start_codon:yes stop_codon:yes gene_type:complete